MERILNEVDAIVNKLISIIGEEKLVDIKVDFEFDSNEALVETFKSAMLNSSDYFIHHLQMAGIVDKINFQETERYEEPDFCTVECTRYERVYTDAEELYQERVKTYEEEQKESIIIGGSYAKKEAPEEYSKWEAILEAEGLELIA